MTKRPTIIVLLSGTKMPRGGLTGSALNRATQLSERGYPVVICTFDYRPDHNTHVDLLRQEGLVGRKVEFRNFYEHFKLKRAGSSSRGLTLEASALIRQKENARFTRFFSSSGALLYTELTGEGKSLWRRFYTDKRVERRRVEYSIKGTLHRETLFFEDTDQVAWFSYLDEHGRAYFTQWVEESGKLADVFVADEADGDASKRHESLVAAQKVWFGTVLADIDGPVTVMLDDCSMAPLLKNCSYPNVTTIAIFHNDHRTPVHKPMIEGMKSWSAVVCSTEGQAKVLRPIVPKYLKLAAIPQPIPDHRKSLSITNRTPARFAFFGRLDPIKNIVPLVACFADVIKTVPGATLDVFGTGPQESEVQRTVERLNLQQSVHLMGRTDDPLGRMAGYTALVLPSAFEAFGLVIGEAMLTATPVIAFDCDFGPREIIRDGWNGILVANGDFIGLAETIVNLARYPEKARSLGENGRQAVIEQFNNERIMDRWEELVSEVQGGEPRTLLDSH